MRAERHRRTRICGVRGKTSDKDHGGSRRSRAPPLKASAPGAGAEGEARKTSSRPAVGQAKPGSWQGLCSVGTQDADIGPLHCQNAVMITKMSGMPSAGQYGGAAPCLLAAVPKRLGSEAPCASSPWLARGAPILLRARLQRVRAHPAGRRRSAHRLVSKCSS